MKKALFTFLPAMLVALTLSAQPTLTNNVFFTAGQTITTAEADATNVSEGNAGANQTWNFANLQVIAGSTTSGTVANAAGTPYAAQFPQANLVVTSVDSGVTTYAYLQQTATQVNLLGIASDEILLPYTNPQLQLQVPLAYNASFTDTYASMFDFQGITINQSGTRTSTYDAYGTLTTPNGTFPNAVRVRTEELRRDSSNFGFGYAINVSNEVTYDFYVPNRPGPVVTISYSEGFNFLVAPGLPADTTFNDPSKTVTFQILSTTGVVETPAQRWGLEVAGVSPNPTVDVLDVRFSATETKADLRLLVFDAQGRMLRTQELPTGSLAGRTRLDVASLAPGTYTLSLTDGKLAQSVPFVKM